MKTCNRSWNTRMRGLLATTLLFCAVATTPAAAEETDWAALAGYWTPVIVQGMSYDFNTDVIAAMDSDGDWNMANNGSGKRFGIASVVYYWVTESAGYYYIGYALYHLGGVIARDEGSTRFGNDMQGVVLAIQKSEPENEEQPMGQFVALRTWGTDQPLFYTEISTQELSDDAAAWLAQNVSETLPAGDAIGDIDFVIDSLGFHPVIYSRAGDHVVFGEKDRAQFRAGPPHFESQHIVDWRHIPTIIEGGDAELRTRWHRPGNSEISGGAGGIPIDDGLLYRYEGKSMEVITTRTAGRGTVLHHWNLIAYDLEPISQLWERRLDHESGQSETFTEYGVFASEGHPGPSSRAPWAWGAVFFDPADAFAAILPEAADDGAGTILATSFESPETLAEEYASRVKP